MFKSILIIVSFLFSLSGFSQLTEGFEGATFPPTNWAVFDNGVNAAPPVNWTSSTIASTGSKAAFMNKPGNIGVNSTARDFLASPAVTIASGSELKFFTRMILPTIQVSKYQVRIKLVSVGAQNDPLGYNTLVEYTDANLVQNYSVYEQKTVVIPPAYIGVPVYIAFCCEVTQPAAAVAGNRWLVDDINIVQACVTPADTSLTSAPILSNSATFGWTATPGTASYDIENVLLSQDFTGVPTGNTTTNSYVQTGLSPLVCYQYRVRANCGNNNFGPWSFVAKSYCTTAGLPACGGNFIDNGGILNNYLANSNITTTICPTVPGEVVTVTFSAFNTEVNYDALYVYDAQTALAAAQIKSGNSAQNVPGGIADGYWGPTVPGPFISTSPDGCLTFVFRSSASDQLSGWISTVTCGPRPSCARPNAVVISSINSATATLSWTQPPNPNNTTATSWQVVAVPCAALIPAPNATSWQTATTNPYTYTGLTPNTCYDFYIKAICSPTDSSTTSIKVTATTQLAPPVCGGNYTDIGGATGNYATSANITTTICPLNAGDVVTVTFTAFDTEARYDGIYVYDGNATTAPLIPSSNPVGSGNSPLTTPGAYWGTTIPGPFTSTSADGCLTFVFKSDGSTERAGWTSNVTCGPRPSCAKPTAVVVSAVTSTAATLVWTQPLNANNTTATQWQVIAVACNALAPSATAAWITVNTNPTYTFPNNLTPDTCYDFYVKAICSPTEPSALSTKVTATTQLAPPLCGGIFTDNGGANGNYLADSNVTTTICPTIAGQVVTVTFTTFDVDEDFDGLYAYDGNTAVAANQIASTNAGTNIPGGLAGAYWGTTNPGPFTSTTADGCLTFVFRSSSFTQNAGWNSNVTCAPRPTCAKPKNLVSSGLTATTMLLSWTQPLNANGSTATAWQVIAVTCGSPVPTATNPAWSQPTTLNPYPFTTLLPNTCYDFYVKAICSPTDSSGLSVKISVTTPPTCGSNFYDNGGLAANYLNNSNTTTTICPTIPGDLVTVTFTSFNSEANWDGLYVYDGNLVNPATQIPSVNPPGNGTLTVPGAYWGTINPGSFTSSSADGCLTFVFISDNSGQRAGWNASVTCAPRPSCSKPNFLIADLLTQVSATLTWTQLLNPNNSIATAWQYIVLPQGAPAPTATTTGWILTNTNGSNLVNNLTSATCYEFYVRAVCSSTDSSLWAGPKKFCTLIANDECSGATPTPVNPAIACLQVVSGSLLGATNSAQANICGGGQSPDVWFSFVATTANHVATISDIIGPAFSLNIAVYSGFNCSTLNEIGCLTTGSQITLPGLNIGQTYYLRVFLDASATNSNITFNLCVATLPAVITANTTQYTPQQLVTNVLLNSTCASVSNITFATETDGIGYFNQNGSTFPFTDGVILSTGNASEAFGPNNSTLGEISNSSATDADLEAIILATTGEVMNSKNTTKLEFDFTPITSNISFDFLFASEEYGQFQCDYSDAFAFLLTNLSTNVTTNLAIVPGTDPPAPISVVTVRNGEYNLGCDSVNPQFFGQYNINPPSSGINRLASPTNFNGQTVPLTAASAVTINQPYHIKLVIADRNDTNYDSAVFLKGSSFGIGNLNLGNNLLQSTGNALCFGAFKIIDTGLNPLIYSFVWKKDGVLLSFTTPSITVSVGGTYSVTVTYIGSNCIGTDEVIIEFYSDLAIGTPSNLIACSSAGTTGFFNLTQNTPLVLPPAIGGSYVVNYFTTQADATANTNPISSINELAYNNSTNPQTIYVRVRNSATGCFKTTSFSLSVQNNPPVFTTQPTIAFCPGQSGTIVVTPSNFALENSTYAWKKDNVLLASTTSTLNVTQPGTYVVIVSNNGCSETSTTVVSFLTITADFSSNIIACDSYTLPALTPNNGYFTGANGTGNNIAAGTAITNSITPLYIYKLVGFCNDESSFNITINKTPVIPIIPAVSKCDSYTLPILTIGNYFTATNGAGLQKNAGDVITTTQTLYVFAQTNTVPNCFSERSFVITITQTPTIATILPVVVCEKYVLPALTVGNYFTATNGGGNQLAVGSTITTSQVIYAYAATATTPNCFDEKSFNVTINKNPMFGIVGGCKIGQYTLDVVPQINGDTYKWTTISGAPFGASASSQVVNQTGTYNCEVTNSDGCKTKVPFVVDNVVCEIQKGISPNNDGLNDKLDLTTLKVKLLEIYSRYGSKVYSLTNYTNEWEGQSDAGNTLPDGTYYYVAELGDGNTKTGWIYINKENK